MTSFSGGWGFEILLALCCSQRSKRRFDPVYAVDPVKNARHHPEEVRPTKSILPSRAGPMTKVLLLESNEISPPIFKRWMDQGKLPKFSTFYDSSQVFTSIADVSDPDYLEPRSNGIRSILD